MSLSASETGRSMRQHKTLKVYLLGCVDFDSLLTLQERALQEIHYQQDESAVLFVCEHPPMVTVGREGSHHQLSGSYHDLKAKQIEVRWTNRGGGALLHAPGQLAVYPLFPLKQLGIGISEFRDRLQRATRSAAGEQGVDCETCPDDSGILGRCGQFAFLGAAIKSWISYYGLYINVSPDMKLQRLIDANRFDHRVTSLSATLTREASMGSVRESMIRNLAQQFGYPDPHIFTRHPLLHRAKKKVYVDT